MDTMGIVSLGLWPAIISELNPQIISFGYMSSLESPPTSIIGKIKRWITMRRRSRV